MLVVLSGGTGGAKLIEGLSHEIDAAQLTVVCNTADDFVLHGLNISPDLDTIMYTLAGMSDSAKGWGIQDDTFTVLTTVGKTRRRDVVQARRQRYRHTHYPNMPLARRSQIVRCHGQTSEQSRYQNQDSSHVGRRHRDAS